MKPQVGPQDGFKRANMRTFGGWLKLGTGSSLEACFAVRCVLSRMEGLWIRCGYNAVIGTPGRALSLSLCVMAPVIIFRSLGLLECRHCLLQLSF